MPDTATYHPFGTLNGGPLAEVGTPPAYYPEAFAVVKVRRDSGGTTFEYDVVDYVAREHFSGAHFGFQLHEVVGVYAWDGNYECFQWIPAEAFADGGVKIDADGVDADRVLACHDAALALDLS